MELQVDAPSSKSTLQASSRRSKFSSEYDGAPSRRSKLQVDALRSSATTLEQPVDAPSSKSTLQAP
eukprot:528175-Rhodomonas_salina.1